jgi:two-component system sensor histidine kinase KdpD
VAAETEALRNTLLASISHDLRAPLAVITGASTALADPSLSFDPEARASLARTIASRARDMSELVSNVLDLMRFESGQVPLRRQWETLDDLVGLALGRVEPRLGRRSVSVELPKDLPAIDVDAVLFTQVLTNLLENAAKHTPDGTRIRITARVENRQISILVEDDGPGLPAGDPNRLFAKFQRGRSEGEIPGAGLGLAICRAVVKEHGGSISASNRDGGGTRIAICLPAADQKHD